MKPRNLVIFGSEEWLKTLEAEYRMLGFYVKCTPESLTVYSARPRKEQAKKKRNPRFNRDASKSRNS